MEIQPDFRDPLELFNEHQVDYIIVGAYALAFYGAPRFTGDIDFYVKPDAVNAEQIMNALEEFGFGSLDLSPSDFDKKDQVIQLGVPPVRIDIITSITGVDWEEAYSGRVEGKYGNVPVYYIGREQFIKNKLTLGRNKDLADIEMLGE
ncbi:MAG: hypothetical protein ISS19_03815 [Bacteroidales bacterium]|nr:hypothetical protein [Bacteroidales bacterium]